MNHLLTVAATLALLTIPLAAAGPAADALAAAQPARDAAGPDAAPAFLMLDDAAAQADAALADAEAAIVDARTDAFDAATKTLKPVDHATKHTRRDVEKTLRPLLP